MVSHLFFHSLVADPKRAFDGDDEAKGYLDYMVTIDEFKKII
ncbi:polysaccharide deacetylase, partial [Kocuria koreensis]|nr:polysaccharide deacetylase [Rothia koreensis]